MAADIPLHVHTIYFFWTPGIQGVSVAAREGIDDDMDDQATPLESAMDGLWGRVRPLYCECCVPCGDRRGGVLATGGPAGYVFWHDGWLHRAALTGWLKLRCKSLDGTGEGDAETARVVAEACEAAGMRVVRERGGDAHVETELAPVDREWFEGQYDGYLDQLLEEEREMRAEQFHRTTRYRAFFEHFRERRWQVEGFRRRRAARVIEDAVLDWVCRPGGRAAVGAKRSFEDLSGTLSASGRR